MSPTLEFLKQLAHGLAVQFGNSCEIVIHDLTRGEPDNSIVHIENGHVSNRTAGDGPSGIVLETLQSDPSLVHDRLAYLTKTDTGKILKSSTFYLRDEEGKISYIFALNYDITSLMAAESAIQALLKTNPEEPESSSGSDGFPQITHNVNDLLDALIEQAVQKVGKPPALMNKEDKVAVVKYLNDAGAFLITRSGDKVSSYLGISKFTLYSYMDKN